MLSNYFNFPIDRPRVCRCPFCFSAGCNRHRNAFVIRRGQDSDFDIPGTERGASPRMKTHYISRNPAETNFTSEILFAGLCLQRGRAWLVRSIATKTRGRSMLNVYRPFESAFRHGRWTIGLGILDSTLACRSLLFSISRDYFFLREYARCAYVQLFSLRERRNLARFDAWKIFGEIRWQIRRFSRLIIRSFDYFAATM